MIVGKTGTSISVPELFEKYPEVSILTTVFPEITSVPCKIQSPFRVDNNPSFSIYMDDSHHIMYKDFGDSESKGSLLDLLCRKWKCSFNQVLDRIIQVMQEQSGTSDGVRMKKVRTLTRKEYSGLTKIEVKVRPWKEYDLQYWESYGITKPWLKYAEIYPISHKIITKKKQDGEVRQYVFTADRLAYCYVERKEGNLQIKIYQPFNTKGFKWCSCMDSSVISLWTKVPEYGDRIVICSSLKDALCLSANLHIPAIAPQGEGYSMSESACRELRRRYRKIFICFDNDVPGRKDAERLSEMTGFPFIVPDLGNTKDISDYYKSLENKEEFKKLDSLFN